MPIAKNTIRAFMSLGVSFVGASKKLKRLAAKYGGLDLEKLKRKEQYLRQYHNRRGVMK